jgi:hypothetical protein
MKLIFSILFSIIILSLHAQDKTLPYDEIPAQPQTFTAGTVAAHLIDAVGFRFYWATDGLRETDLSFKPNADARTSEQTIAHIYEMSILIVNSVTNKVNVDGQDVKLPFNEMRKQTLINFKITSDKLRTASDRDMESFKVMFKDTDRIIEYPFWNQINGPITDCLWHIGQVVSFRRSSGNPFTEKANLFMGIIDK